MMRAQLLLLALLAAAVAQAGDAPRLFQQHCAACHGPARLGGSGPALLPESLARLKKTEALDTIAHGRVATRMPAFGGQIAPADLDALVDYLYTPVIPAPSWSEDDIRASRSLYHAPGSLPDKPKFTADRLNLFIVVETGDHHVTLLDGDTFEPIKRFPTHFALHGGPKFSPDGRYVYFASRDGWVSRFDIWNLEYTAEVRVGINTRNIAVSSDGRYVMAANYLPDTVVILNADDLSLVETLPAADAAGHTSRVSAVYDAAPRRSFIVALKDVPELWEVSYADAGAAAFPGLVRDGKIQQNAVLPGKFTLRRTRLDSVLDDFFFDQDYTVAIGASRNGQGQVVNLDTRRKIADLPLHGMPHLGSGITWKWQGREVLATPNLKAGRITVVDMSDWHVVKEISTPGPGFFMRSHENTPYAWTDVFNGAAKDTLQLIEKSTLEIVATLTPAPGKTAAHVEFTRDGRYALVSIWENDGALVVYDAASLREIKRIQMNKPSGKYNIFNKINRSSGTSH